MGERKIGIFFIGDYAKHFTFSLSFPTKIQISLSFPKILTIFQIPRVYQVFYVFQVCGHPVKLYGNKVTAAVQNKCHDIKNHPQTITLMHLARNPKYFLEKTSLHF